MWVWDSVSDHDPLLELEPKDCSYHLQIHFLKITFWFPSCWYLSSYAANRWSPVGTHHSFSNCFSTVSIWRPSYINLNLFMLNEEKMHANIRKSWSSRANRSWERRGAPRAMPTHHHQALFRELEHDTLISWQIKIQAMVVSSVCYEMWHRKSLSILPHTLLPTSAEAYPWE